MCQHRRVCSGARGLGSIPEDLGSRGLGHLAQGHLTALCCGSCAFSLDTHPGPHLSACAARHTSDPPQPPPLPTQYPPVPQTGPLAWNMCPTNNLLTGLPASPEVLGARAAHVVASA